MRGNTCRACCQMVFKTGRIWRVNNDHKTVREAWEIVKGVVKSLEHQAEWTKEEIHNNEPVADAFATLENVINSNSSNEADDLLDYYNVIWRQASGVDVERDRKIRFAISALSRIESDGGEVVTVDTLNWMFKDVPYGGESAFLFDNFPNGLRIVKDK